VRPGRIEVDQRVVSDKERIRDLPEELTNASGDSFGNLIGRTHGSNHRGKNTRLERL
jgi:hypothetical protein